MEPNDNQLSSYFHRQHQQHHQHQHQQGAAAASGVAATGTTTSPTNGLLGNMDGSHSHMVYPHTVPSAVSSQLVEPAKRKRGRPRKYGTPEQALAAKKASTTSSSAHSFSPSTKKALHHPHAPLGAASPSSSSYTSKKSHSFALGWFDSSFNLCSVTFLFSNSEGFCCRFLFPFIPVGLFGSWVAELSVKFGFLVLHVVCSTSCVYLEKALLFMVVN